MALLPQLRWVWCYREAVSQIGASSIYEFAALFAALGLFAQTMYALWLHAVDPCEDDIYSLACRDKLNFFGSKQGEVIAAVAMAGVSLGFCLAWVAYQLLFRLPPLLSSCLALVYAGLGGLRGWAKEVSVRISRGARMLLADPGGGPDACRIQREFELQRVRRARTFSRTISPILCAMLLWILYRHFLTPPVQTSHKEVYWIYMFGSGTMPLLVMLAAAVPADLCPSIVTPRFLDCTSVLSASAYGWMLSVSASAALPFHHHWLLMTRLPAVICLGNARLNTVLLVGTLAIECANTAVRPELSSFKINVIYRDVFVVLAFCGIGWALERFQWAEARALVRAQTSDRSLALVRQLLGCACDAAPRLDAELCLAEPCPSLSALVLREGPIPRGTSFLDLISPEDSEHFHSCLAGRASAPPREDAPGAGEPSAGAAATGAPEAFAGLCHVRLRAAGALLPASCFYSCVPDMDGLPTFLLGIREDPEEGTVRGAAAVAELPDGPMPSLLTALPETAVVVADDLSSSAWSSVADDEGTEAEGALSVWVDSASTDIEVLNCSPGFALLGGAGGPCGSLSEWLSDSDMGRIQRVSDAPEGERRVKLWLYPPGATRYACLVQSGPTGAAAPALGEAAATGAEPARFDFKVIKASTSKRRGQPWEVSRAALQQVADRRAHRLASPEGRLGAAGGISTPS